MTKKKMLANSFLGTILFFIFLFSQKIGLCSVTNLSCFQKTDSVAKIIFIFVPLFILSIIFYFLPDYIYRVWIKFIYVYIPISIILVIISPEFNHSLFQLDKIFVALFVSCLLVFISFIITTVKFFTEKK